METFTVITINQVSIIFQSISIKYQILHVKYLLMKRNLNMSRLYMLNIYQILKAMAFPNMQNIVLKISGLYVKLN